MAGRRFGFRPPSLPADMTQSGDIQLNQMSTKLGGVDIWGDKIFATG